MPCGVNMGVKLILLLQQSVNLNKAMLGDVANKLLDKEKCCDIVACI